MNPTTLASKKQPTNQEPQKSQNSPRNKETRTFGTSKTRSWLKSFSAILPLHLIMLLLVGLPLAVLVITSFTDTSPRPGAGIGNFTLENYARLTSSSSLDAAFVSLITAVGGTAVAMFIGGMTAWLAARTDVPFKGLALLSGMVPLFMSALVGTLAWGLLASPNSGYINVFLQSIGFDWTINIYSLGGIVFVSGIFYAPYSFLMIYSALTLMNPELEEAGRVHGGNMRRVLGKVTFPLVTPAIIGSGILTFALIFENFPIYQVLGSSGNIPSLPAQLFQLMNSVPQQANEAAALGVALLALLTVVIFLQRRLVSRRSYVTVSGKGFRPREIKLGAWRWLGFIFVVVYLLLAAVLPYLALIQSALRSHQFIQSFSDLFDFSVFTLDNFTRAFSYSSFQQGMMNSLLVSLGVAFCGGALYFITAYLVRRTTLPGRSLLEYATNVPLAMPALVLGMGFLWAWIQLPIPIYGTLVILVMAFITRFLPQGFQGIASPIVQIDKDLEDAAIVSGANRGRAVGNVTLPLVKTGVASTMMLVFILSFRELSAALFLFTSDTRIVSVVIYDQWESGQWPQVAAMSLMYSAVLLIATLIGRRWFGLGSPGK